MTKTQLIDSLVNNNTLMDQKLDYIHMKPVKNLVVSEPEHYIYSSAKDFAVGKKRLYITFIE